MHRGTCILAALALTLPASLPAQKLEPLRKAPAPDAPRGRLLEWTSAAGRPYWYRLPESLGSHEPLCLLLMLHGTGMSHAWPFANYPLLNGRWRPHDIVVAPEGVTPGQGDTYNFVQGPKDGDQIAALIKHFRRTFPVDRVYLYGHSQGAFFCYWFVGEHPGLVDGIVAHAGNVLSVKHPREAREQVAIGILHARSDPVVSVSCAIRSEKIYREKGYRLLRLHIVEDIPRRAGHWPLPEQVGAMLDWLDRVTGRTPAALLEGARAALRDEPVDLQALAGSVERAAELLKRTRGQKRDELKAELEVLEGLCERLAEAHAAALKKNAASDEDAGGPRLAAHFRRVEQALGAQAAWRRAVGSLRRSAARDKKAVQRALRALRRPDARTLRGVLGLLRARPLAPSWPQLCGRLEELVASTGSGQAGGASGDLGEEDRTRIQQALEACKAAAEQGREQAAAVTRRVVEAFLEEHPELGAEDG